MTDKIKVPGPVEQKKEPEQKQEQPQQIPPDKPVSWGNRGTYTIGG